MCRSGDQSGARPVSAATTGGARGEEWSKKKGWTVFHGQESSNQEKENGEQGSDESKESTSETIIETEEGLMGPPQPKSPIVGDEVEETIQSLRTELAETKELNT